MAEGLLLHFDFSISLLVNLVVTLYFVLISLIKWAVLQVVDFSILSLHLIKGEYRLYSRGIVQSVFELLQVTLCQRFLTKLCCLILVLLRILLTKTYRRGLLNLLSVIFTFTSPPFFILY